MDKNVIKGKAKQAVGTVKQKAGEVLNDRELQARGAAKRIEGELQESFGEAKDKLRRDH